MSRHIFKSIVAAAVLTVSPLVVADDEFYHPFHVGATVGYGFLDSGRQADDDVLYGLNVGWFLHPRFSIDLEYDKIESDVPPSLVNSFIPGATFNDFNLKTFSLMGRYYFGEGTWRPFVAAGIGYTEHRSIFHTGWDPSLNLGGGVMGQLGDHFATRLQALYRRDGDKDSMPGEDGYDDFIVSANFIYRWGGKEVVAPAPVAAPRDTDGDGVTDDRDRCPNTPAGVKVDENGCPLDSDGDGVPDYRDKCPGTPAGAIVDRDGCEIPPVIELPSVFFEFDKSTLLPVSRNTLDQAAELLTVHEKVIVEVAGHTDSIGTDEYNQGLSQRRAQAVLEYLKEAGINASRMNAKGYGESRPIATNDTAEGRAKNRRTELVVLER